MTMQKIHSEWFWSEQSANAAGKRAEAKGYTYSVRYAMDASGRHDWLLEIFGN
jgi:hypothetical protein